MKSSTAIGLIILTVIITVGVWVHLTAIGVFKPEPVVEILPRGGTNGTLKVVTDADYWPYSFVDRNGKVSGREVELANAIANELGMEIELKAMKWSECLELAGTHAVDMVLTCAEYSTECETDDLTSSLPLGSDNYMVFGKKPLKSLKELHGRRLAQLNYGNVNPTLRAAGFGSEMKLYPSHREAFLAIEKDEADYTVIRYTPAVGLLKEMGLKDIKAQCFAGKSFFCIGINKHRPGLVKKVNDAIMVLRVNGEMDRLSEKWLTTYVEPDTVAEVVMHNQEVFFVFLVIVALLVISLYGLFYLRTRTAARLGEINRAKTEFLFNMSHDIRTPMNAIKGFVEIARKCLDDRERVQDCLDKIDGAGSLLLSLINGVLDMSRIESGKMKLNEIEADVFDSFMGVETIMAEQAKRKDITISFEFGEIRDRYVYVDCDRETRVFVNLISNAIKYTPNGGRIRVVCEQVSGERDVAVPSGCARYRYIIEDNGIGMSEEFQKHLFEQFMREQNSTTSGIQGTGLGLAITKKIIELMRGTIECRSKRGEGTTFVVELPFRVREAAAGEDAECRMQNGEWRNDQFSSKEGGRDQSSSSIRHSSFAGKRVLLVEDNELNREVAEFVLKEHGFEVETAGDGSVAVEMVKGKAPGYYHCVLMDIQMPIMGGYEATRSIRALEHEWNDPSFPHIPIIALSANAFAEDKAASIAAGMDDHVAKPIKVRELLAVLSKLAVSAGR